MNRTTVNAAMESAEKFLLRCKELVAEKAFDPDYSIRTKPDTYYSHPAARGGAVRRASMDLTRDLATMRRPS